MPLTIAESFIYFQKGDFPCLFLLECKEGFARFDVENQKSLDILLNYSNEKKYQVDWARAVADDPQNRKTFRNYPGGKYVATLQANNQNSPD